MDRDEEELQLQSDEMEDVFVLPNGGDSDAEDGGVEIENCMFLPSSSLHPTPLSSLICCVLFVVLCSGSAHSKRRCERGAGRV
jgi:hypothetical protein